MSVTDILAITVFVISDIICSALTPYLSCFIAGIIGQTLQVGKSTEVFFMVAMIVFVSANLLNILDTMLEKMAPGSSTSTMYPRLLQILSFLNLVWLLISIRSLVRASATGSGVTLGSTPFGFFLAALLFTSCKFLVYLTLYTWNVVLPRKGLDGDPSSAAVTSSDNSNGDSSEAK